MIKDIYFVIGSPQADDPDVAPYYVDIVDGANERVYAWGFLEGIEGLRNVARDYIAHTGVTLRLVRFVRA